MSSWRPSGMTVRQWEIVRRNERLQFGDPVEKERARQELARLGLVGEECFKCRYFYPNLIRKTGPAVCYGKRIRGCLVFKEMEKGDEEFHSVYDI